MAKVSVKVYAVVGGKDGFTGTVATWDECKALTRGVKGARYKKFEGDDAEAQAWKFIAELTSAEQKEEMPMTIEAIETRRKEIPAQIKAARDAGDMELVARLAAEFNRLGKQLGELKLAGKKRVNIPLSSRPYVRQREKINPVLLAYGAIYKTREEALAASRGH